MGGSPYEQRQPAPFDYGISTLPTCPECGGRFLPGLGVLSHRGLCSRKPHRGQFERDQDHEERMLRSKAHAHRNLPDDVLCMCGSNARWWECLNCIEHGDRDEGWI